MTKDMGVFVQLQLSILQLCTCFILQFTNYLGVELKQGFLNVKKILCGFT